MVLFSMMMKKMKKIWSQEDLKEQEVCSIVGYNSRNLLGRSSRLGGYDDEDSDDGYSYEDYSDEDLEDFYEQQRGKKAHYGRGWRNRIAGEEVESPEYAALPAVIATATPVFADLPLPSEKDSLDAQLQYLIALNQTLLNQSSKEPN